MDATNICRRDSRAIAPPWLWVRLALNWANFKARDSDAMIWKRLLAWTLLVLSAAFLLGVTAYGVIFIGAGLFTIDSGGIVMIFFGAVLFVFPCRAVWFCVKRWRTVGSLRTSPQELQHLKDLHAAWETSESQKTSRDKLSFAVFVVVLLTGWTIWQLHARRPNFFTLGFWGLFGAYVIWVQFRRPKRDF